MFFACETETQTRHTYGKYRKKYGSRHTDIQRAVPVEVHRIYIITSPNLYKCCKWKPPLNPEESNPNESLIPLDYPWLPLTPLTSPWTIFLHIKYKLLQCDSPRIAKQILYTTLAPLNNYFGVPYIVKFWHLSQLL